jgi:hypothetical protein
MRQPIEPAEQQVAERVAAGMFAHDSAKTGDELSAEAVERALLGRIGVYDVTVTNQEGGIIAPLRGRSYRVTGEVIPSS